MSHRIVSKIMAQNKFVVDCIKARLKSCGFDVIDEFNTSWYNQIKPSQLRLSFPERRLALLIGNSKAIWPHFLEYYKFNKLVKDPFDTFVRETIEDTFRKETQDDEDKSLDYFYSHETAPDRLIAFQKLASICGTAYLDESIHLCVHQTFGAWFALRAVVIFNNIQCSTLDPPPPFVPVLDALELEKARTSLALAVEARKSADPSAARYWIEVRTSLSYGGEHRYDEQQLLYHYTKSRELL